LGGVPVGRLRKRSPDSLPAIPHAHCPAKTAANQKPGLSVIEHNRIVGAVAEQLVEIVRGRRICLLPEGAAAIAALHDIGKVSPGFLLKYFEAIAFAECPPLRTKEPMAFEGWHSVVSEATFRAWCLDQGRNLDWSRWGEALGAHHGTRTEPLLEPSFKYGGPEWLKERCKLLESILEEFGPLPKQPPTPEQLLVVSGLVSTADWIGSDESWFPAEGLSPGQDLRLAAKEAVAEAGWRRPELIPGRNFADLFGHDQLRPAQKLLHDVAERPGLFILEAPTGMGKTEAALWAAYRLVEEGHADGLYFALPTRLTSNRIHERVARFISRAFEDEPGARLVHAQAWLAADTGGEELRPGGSWFNPRKRALLYPFGVGTIDQALLAVMQVKHHFVRSFGLAGKVVILDEVHSYDLYTGTLLDVLVDHLRQLDCTVIILSATLTHARRQALLGAPTEISDDYPLLTAAFGRDMPPVTFTCEPPASATTQIEFLPDEVQLVASRVADEAEQGACVLWICNTVARSQAAFRAVRAQVRQGLQVGLLHSRFPAWRREALEADWLAKLGPGDTRPAGCILVATQVVEQSVDIDADLLVTDLAPTDMLIQRMGRLWRHERGRRPVDRRRCIVVSADLDRATDVADLKERAGHSHYIYAPYILWRSHAVWRERASVELPCELRPLLEATYLDPADDDPDWIRALHAEMREKSEKLRRLALALTTPGLPLLSDSEHSPTRYSDRQMIPILLLRECRPTGNRAELLVADGQACSADAYDRQVSVAKAIHRNLVSLPKFPDFEIPVKQGWLAAYVYGGAVPLLIEQDGRLHRLDGAATRYAYTNTHGIWRLEEQGPDTAYMEDPFDESDW